MNSEPKDDTVGVRHKYAKNHCVTRIRMEELSEAAIFKAAQATTYAYERAIDMLNDKFVNLRSPEAIKELRNAITFTDSEIALPRLNMKMPLLRWCKKQIRLRRFQRAHLESIEANELGINQPFLSDKLSAIVAARRLAVVSNDYTHTLEASRTAKHTCHAWGIKTVAEAVGLHGVLVTAAMLGGDEEFPKRWRHLQRRVGAILGLWVRHPHLSGLPHWHLMLYVEPERMQALLKAIAQIFGSGPGVDVKPIKPGYSTLIPYLLKNLERATTVQSKSTRLAQRATNFRTISGKRSIQFFDCASSKKWDRLRSIKIGTNAFLGLSSHDQSLWHAAVHNNYALFILLSAQAKVKKQIKVSPLILKITSVNMTTLALREVTRDPNTEINPAKWKSVRTVAHINKYKDKQPSAAGSILKKKPAEIGQNGTNEPNSSPDLGPHGRGRRLEMPRSSKSSQRIRKRVIRQVPRHVGGNQLGRGAGIKCLVREVLAVIFSPIRFVIACCTNISNWFNSAVTSFGAPASPSDFPSRKKRMCCHASPHHWRNLHAPWRRYRIKSRGRLSG